jgi:hypothetical protein
MTVMPDMAFKGVALDIIAPDSHAGPFGFCF